IYKGKVGKFHKSKRTKTELSFVTVPLEIVMYLIVLQTTARISGVPLYCILSYMLQITFSERRYAHYLYMRDSKMSISGFMGYLKGIRALLIFRK
ncbi:MAG: hypothetical protein ACI4SJ_00775, partial [Candidatus Avispirillum sp.]